ncbi:hypothetical protein LguiA_000615 [Lonicera macranthoides]
MYLLTLEFRATPLLNVQYSPPKAQSVRYAPHMVSTWCSKLSQDIPSKQPTSSPITHGPNSDMLYVHAQTSSLYLH